MENIEVYKDLLEGFNIDGGISSVVIACIVVGMLTIIAVFIIIFAFIWKRHRGTFFTYAGGVATALIFYVTGASIANAVLYPFPESLTSSPAFCIVVAALVSALMAWGGRLIAMKLFEKRMEKVPSSFSIGLGIMTVEAVSKVIKLFVNLIMFYSINDIGCKVMLNRAADKADFENTLLLLKESMAVTPGSMIYTSVITILFMVFYVAMSVPMFAAFKKQVSKLHYLICLGALVCAEALVYMRSYKVLTDSVYMVLLVLLLVVFVLYVMRIYYRFYKKEAFEHKEKEENKPKMPRFGNLSNL